MKKTLFFMMFAIFGLVGFSGCDKGVNKAVNPPVQPDHVSIRTNMNYIVNEYTYSLSTPPPPPAFVGSISFAVSVTKNNSGVQAAPSDITWSTTGAELVLNNTIGTMVVKATYLDGTIDEMSKTVTIHVVA